MDHDDHGDGWDEDFAAGLIGATILVGLTHRLPTGDEQEQFFGSVLTADARAGVTLLLEGERKGETFRLPPDLGALEPAEAGEYRLASTGEIVIDPDYVATWIVDPPKQ